MLADLLNKFMCVAHESQVIIEMRIALSNARLATQNVSFACKSLNKKVPLKRSQERRVNNVNGSSVIEIERD